MYIIKTVILNTLNSDVRIINTILHAREPSKKFLLCSKSVGLSPAWHEELVVHFFS